MASLPLEQSTAPISESEDLSVSIVVYRPNPALLASTLESLGRACASLLKRWPDWRIRCFLIDNGGLPDISASIEALHAQGVVSTTLGGHGTVGYGRGHNVAIELAHSEFHLILNPDIEMEADALVSAIEFWRAHPELGLLTPRVRDDRSQLQYLCRRYPALVDLFARGFMPASWRKRFERRLARYEMRDLINDKDVVWNPPIVSGCFMLFRTDLLKRLAGFDPRYFLYFEDYDLSLRTHELAPVAYVPRVHVLHHGGGAARKGSAHIRMFVSSAIKFYNRFGWKLI